MIQKIKITLIGLTLIGAAITVFSAPALADEAACGDTCSSNGGAASTSDSTGGTLGNGCANSSSDQNCLKQDKIVIDLNKIVNFISAAVGIIVTGVIILGGIQYSAAGDNPSAITAAKQRITNGLIALVVFIFLFALLQYLIPGGIFS